MSFNTDVYRSGDIPGFLLSALSRVRQRYDHDLFRNGGCGILVTALAALCQQHNETCEISLIHRYDPLSNTDTLSHIVLGLPDLGIAVDIDGADADCRWVEMMIDNEVLIYGASHSEFSFQDIVIVPGSPAPLRHLQRITEDYRLRTPVLPLYGQVLATAMGKVTETAA